jgi:hypothetical protein
MVAGFFAYTRYMMNDKALASENAATSIVAVTLALSIAYAILRYHILGPIPWAACTSSEHMAPFEPFSKRHFSARTFSSLACLSQFGGALMGCSWPN